MVSHASPKLTHQLEALPPGLYYALATNNAGSLRYEIKSVLDCTMHLCNQLIADSNAIASA